MPDDASLAREFAIFARHLGTPVVDTRLVAAYVRAHQSLPDRPSDRFDAWLAEWARGGTARCALADSYARLARPFGLLRRKLVLTLAVLESMPATHGRYDTAIASSPAAAWTALVTLGLRWGGMTLVAAIVLAPVHLRLAAAGGRPASEHG